MTLLGDSTSSQTRSRPSEVVMREESRGVLVLGAQGVLGALLARAFAHAGWHVRPAGRRPDPRPEFRHVDLAEPESLAAALIDVDVVVNTVPDLELTAERMVLYSGGLLLNVSAMPWGPGQKLRREAHDARGTVMMNAGIAPGITNLAAADLVAEHSEADEIELVFTVSVNNGAGRAGREFAHRGVTAVAHHRTARIPLPPPLGSRRCLGFAEPDRGWLGAFAGARTVSPYVCITEGPPHAALLAANRTRLMSRLPRAAFHGSPGATDESGTTELVAHWVAVRRQGELIAARTVSCLGDYRGAAAATVELATPLVNDRERVPPGVFDPDELLSLRELGESLARAGITARRADPA
jgi:NAD(P)-dependent dehydrogenase (short-subunit alcohol dehydrogenase family)